MPKVLLDEILKLEARLKRFLENEKEAAETLRKCVLKFKELNSFIDSIEETPTTKEKEKLQNLRLEALQELSRTLEKFSDAEHEKSHMLESYGTVLLELEKAVQSLRKE